MRALMAWLDQVQNKGASSRGDPRRRLPVVQSDMARGGPTYPERFGSTIREHREARDLTQDQLADAAGLNRAHISLIERGHRSVRLETIERLARALQVQPGDLLPRIRLGARSE